MSAAIHPASGRLTKALALLIAVLAASIASAGDEDISPSVYQEFDPVTGYMVIVESPPAGQDGHGATGEEAAATPPPSAGDPAASRLWLPVAAMVLVLAALAAWLKSRGRPSAIR